MILIVWGPHTLTLSWTSHGLQLFQSVCVPVCMCSCLYVFLSVCVPVCMCFCLYVFLSVCVPACMCSCLYVFLYVCVPACMCSCLYVFLSVLSLQTVCSQITGYYCTGCMLQIITMTDITHVLLPIYNILLNKWASIYHIITLFKLRLYHNWFHSLINFYKTYMFVIMLRT